MADYDIPETLILQKIQIKEAELRITGLADALRTAQSEQTDRVAKMYDHEWWGTEAAKANRYEADQAVNAVVKSRMAPAADVASISAVD